VNDFETHKTGTHKILSANELALKQAKSLLTVARCPDTACQDGVIPVQIADDEWQAQQCQWCDERKALCES